MNCPKCGEAAIQIDEEVFIERGEWIEDNGPFDGHYEREHNAGVWRCQCGQEFCLL